MVDVLPGREEARELGLVDRLDLLAQRGDAGTADPAQDVGVTPLALAAAWEQLAADEVAAALELAQRRCHVEAEPPVDRRGRERPVGPRVAANEGEQGIRLRLEEGVGEAGRRRHAERVAV